MATESGGTLARQWAMLRRIPRAPSKITVAELAAGLGDEGFRISRRSLERDLHALSARFPLVLDDRAKPYGWSWMPHASLELLPRLTPAQAVAILLAKTHLHTLLPQNLHRELQPVFAAAERELAATGWKDWHRRTAVIPNTLRLLPPRIEPGVMAAVQSALARDRCLEGTYRSKGADQGKRLRIHPLGLLSRGPVLYLVGTLFDYDDVRQLALHRLHQVEVSTAPARPRDGFDLQAYAATSGATFQDRGPIRLVARFAAAAAEHLRETRLSADQTWTLVEQGERAEVTATVADDASLRWWLLGFGDLVEVLAPPSLRADLASALQGALGQYRSGATHHPPMKE